MATSRDGGIRGEERQGAPITVVHVDDDSAFLSTTVAFLTSTYDDLSIESFTDPQTVLARLETGGVDCVVSDYSMPEMDGLDLLSAVRESWTELPFVLYTGAGDEQLASDAIAAGVTEYVPKRTSEKHYDLLVKRIRDAVAAHRARRRAAELAHVTGIIREINQALLRADSRMELFEDATKALAEADPYVAACIGVLVDGRLERQAWAGSLTEAFEFGSTSDRSEVAALSETAIEERRLQVRQRLATDPIELDECPIPGTDYQSVAAVPMIEDGDPFGVLVVYAREPFAFDDTERDLLEEVAGDIGFAAHALALTDRLEHRAVELELLTRVLRHDVRNDIQVVLGWCGLLSERVSPDEHECVQKIEHTGRHIVELTDSAREVVEAVVADGDTPLSVTAVTPVLEAEVEKAREAYGDAAFSLDVDTESPSITANEMLASVFRNVLNNAVQHNDTDVPEIAVTVVEGDDAVLVRIADNGPGIPPDLRESVFGKGEYGLGSSGTGMGLYLVDTLVDLYGGDVWIEDNDPGTVVALELPTV